MSDEKGDVTKNRVVAFLSAVLGAFIAGAVAIVFVGTQIERKIQDHTEARPHVEMSPATLASDLPVGSVLASMLKEPQFQKVAGSDWILADGRSVGGSDYAVLTGNVNVPNLQGVFLRGVDQGEGRDPEGQRSAGHYQEDQFQAHTFTASRILLAGRVWQHSASDQGVDGHGYSLDHEKAFESYPVGNPVEGGSGEPRYGSETRPKNVAVYFYVRVGLTAPE